MTLEEEWEAFLAVETPAFPNVPSGVDLDKLVDDTVDCLQVFLATGSLDPERRGILRACGADLRDALPSLSGAPAAYLTKLGDLASAILLRVDRNRPSWLG